MIAVDPAGPQDGEPHRTDTASTKNAESLATLFGLLPVSQRDADLVRMIGDVGIGIRVTKCAVKLAQQEAVAGMCRSFANRQHCAELRCSEDREAYEGGEDLESRPGIASSLAKLVSKEDARAFQRDDDRLLDSLLHGASAWFDALRCSGALGEASALASSIHTNAILKGFGRLEKPDPNMSNKTCTEPGPGKQPRASTFATRVPFDKLVLREWLIHADNPAKAGDLTQGMGARTLVVEFAALLVVRTLSEGRPAAEAGERFRTFWEAMDENGLLEGHLKRAPTSLKIGDELFFGKEQLAIIGGISMTQIRSDSTGACAK